MKKMMCILICLTILIGLMTACGKAVDSDTSVDTDTVDEAILIDAFEGALQNVDDVEDVAIDEIEQNVSDDDAEEESEAEDQSGADFERQENVTLEGVSYVLIYNPLIYDELDEGSSMLTSLYSGDFSSQVITGISRAGGLADDTLNVPVNISQRDINAGLDFSEAERTGSKAGGADPVYEVGDQHNFFRNDSTMSVRLQSIFECVYAGEFCYIWSLDGSIDESTAEQLAEEFDSLIYPMDVETFGSARFTDNGGKINILFYPMQEGVGGFFCLYDIFASDEVPELMAVTNGMNTDHAVININSQMLDYDMDFVKSTLAHELQHLICATDAFNYMDSPFMRTWLNEAMSAYAEEIVYPGIKESGGYNEVFYLSDNFRTGQSLYNFDTTFDEFIGAYGAVYLYSQYLRDQTGEDIFKDIHEYWRESYSAEVTEAEALVNSVDTAYRDRIESGYSYPAPISKAIGNTDDEWMSKMTLDFYIETLSMQLAQLEEYEDVAHLFMLYDEINPVEIEGGGRVIVATEGDSFTIPEDADAQLLYIGLNEDFEVVTEPVSVYG